MKLDLDDIERKARAAESDEWRWRPANGDILEGKENGQIVLAGEDLLCSVADRAHIAANSPPVTLALIARIRELEAGQAQIARVFTGDAATARVVAAAVAFVDEQGARVSIERGHTIGQADDFAGEQFAELVRAVEAAGR